MVTTAPTTDKAANALQPEAAASPDGGTYVEVLRTLDDAGLPCLVGGAHALTRYTSGRAVSIGGASDKPEVYLKPDDQRKALNALVHAGFRVEYVSPIAMARAIRGEECVDIVFAGMNGLGAVDDDWFRYAISADVTGYPVRVCPAEELLWRLAFVQQRTCDRQADIAPLILRQGRTFDWQRLLRRFHGHERVLLAHCILFGYVYPTEQSCVPDWVLDYLNAAVRHEAEPHVKLCRGTLLSPDDYAEEIASHEFVDGRLKPHGPLSADDLDLIARAVCPDRSSDAPSSSAAPSSQGVDGKIE